MTTESPTMNENPSYTPPLENYPGCSPTPKETTDPVLLEIRKAIAESREESTD